MFDFLYTPDILYIVYKKQKIKTRQQAMTDCRRGGQSERRKYQMEFIKKMFKWSALIFSAVTTLFCMYDAVKEKDKISSELK